jgi:intracellular sulfur oxidation DsrE/DsrF family protein
MSSGDTYSDEKLHLFFDDELDSNDRAETIEALRKDDELSNRVCELIQLKDSVRLAYDDLPAPAAEKTHWQTSRTSGVLLNAVTASLLIVVGVAGGWFLYPQFQDANLPETIASATREQTDKIILHISKSDPKQFATALDYTKRFLDKHDSTHQIDVVAHAGGLDLMRADISPLKNQIIALMDKYPNVHFIACAGAIRMFQKKNGVKPVIIEGVSTDMTAFDHIVGRLQTGGWKYIKVETLSET